MINGFYLIKKFDFKSAFTLTLTDMALFQNVIFVYFHNLVHYSPLITAIYK